jgi:hypothetical protein
VSDGPQLDEVKFCTRPIESCHDLEHSSGWFGMGIDAAILQIHTYLIGSRS